ncbi:4Fe-4S dicluster domain-containing protein [Acidiferrimicrobium sp. IK]|uniref:heterodisulfide reductase-related iron-sulfur binding cluster n=1 Tax=Acidiferrimicrobium sp. IK TaxID=2871700 RepID=UPI0021CB4916|nr:heterodisulfide reductase-related iron-sulfur binding cluster [Acidiferrimicrobium sp. IK]MCU4184081.1 4Fe-4S dicluster domain-containing protein [Acidiferrimicrobium sp. IK]
MTVTYDPNDPAYYDETDLRTELTRVYDLCHGCRLCLSLCPSFPTMFDAIDARDGAVEELTAAEQDKVVDECYQCKLCYVKCPYIPPHEWQLDFPKLMQRAEAVQNRHHGDLKGKITTQVLGHTDLIGTLSSAAAPIANRAIATPGSAIRKLMDKTVGVAAERVLPPYARTRFSTWFKKRRRRGESRLGRPEQARAAIFSTCLVEYQNPAIGKDLVKVYERNGVTCDMPDGAGCCGAPWLHSGEFGQFTKQAAANVEKLAASVRAGNDIVVPQPTCGYVLKRDYPEYLKTEDARLVAAHTYDAAEYLWKLHKNQLKPESSSVSGDTSIDTEFAGDVPETTAYHVPCHLQAQNIGLRSRDLIKLTGSKVTAINKCSGIDGMWGMRSENYDLARKVAQPLAQAIDKADAEVVAGDCHLANGAIDQETGRRPLHPLQLLARAYGIPEELDDPRR